MFHLGGPGAAIMQALDDWQQSESEECSRAGVRGDFSVSASLVDRDRGHRVERVMREEHRSQIDSVRGRRLSQEDKKALSDLQGHTHSRLHPQRPRCSEEMHTLFLYGYGRNLDRITAVTYSLLFRTVRLERKRSHFLQGVA
jgi:hypothetical protein